MKKLKEFIFSKRVRDIILISLFVFVTELIVRFVTNIDINYGILRIFISSLIIGMIVSLISSYFNKVIGKIIKIIISFLLTFYIFVEVGLYNYLGFYMGIGNGEQGAKNLSYILDFLKSVKPTYYLVFIPFILLILYYIFIDKKLLKFEETKKSKRVGVKKLIPTLISLITIVILSGIYYSTLIIPFMQNKLESTDNKTLFLYPENSNLSVSQFGVLVYGVTDINSIIFDINIEDVDKFENVNGENNNDVITDYSRIINDDAWNSLISNEKNSTYNNLNNYFINRDITSKNEYTGIFKDKNLIVILLESVNEIALEKEFFPNIWKIYSEGISFRNNYSPRNNCSTGNNEMTVMTGLYSINNTCTANKYKNNEYYQAIFNIFKNSGYNATSYHSYTDKYYSRHTIHKNMGSEKFYGVVDLGMEYSNIYEEWPSDLTFFETAMPYFINQDKFLAFMTTVTTHQTYNVPSTLGDKYLDLFSDTEYSTTTKRYLSKMYELDKALGYMLEELEKNGKLDDTVIAMFSDHYPYGLTNTQINSVLDYDVNIRQEVDRTPMVIYNSKIEPKEITKYTSLVDLLPTLLNMFDLNYDPRLYFGTDIMSDNVGRVAFADGSWQDEVGFYSATNGKFTETNNEGKTYTIDEIKMINKEISTEKKMSNLAIKNNYFEYLKDGLEKNKVVVSDVVENSDKAE
ncbi:MAG: sulfatase-like hydrolase/transferase [Bacilli bacterium]|nr:sulfatase-like hydrolase/transferase [Bacilli bacterium]